MNAKWLVEISDILPLSSCRSVGGGVGGVNDGGGGVNEPVAQFVPARRVNQTCCVSNPISAASERPAPPPQYHKHVLVNLSLIITKL